MRLFFNVGTHHFICLADIGLVIELELESVLWLECGAILGPILGLGPVIEPIVENPIRSLNPLESDLSGMDFGDISTVFPMESHPRFKWQFLVGVWALIQIIVNLSLAVDISTLDPKM